MTYLGLLEENASKSAEDAREEFRDATQRDLAQYRASVDFSLEASRAAITAGQASLRVPIITNGGAAIALLAFLGSILATTPPGERDLHGFPGSLFTFLLGVLAGAIASGLAYFAAYAAASQSSKCFHLFNSLTILTVIASHICFLVGGTMAYCSFTASYLASRTAEGTA